MLVMPGSWDSLPFNETERNCRKGDKNKDTATPRPCPALSAGGTRVHSIPRQTLRHPLLWAPVGTVAFTPSPSQGETSVETNTTEPEWNEQISFIEMFPPLSRKIKVQVLDDANVGDVAIATHYIDLQEISDPDRNGETWHGCLGARCPGQPCAMHFLLGMLVSWR